MSVLFTEVHALNAIILICEKEKQIYKTYVQGDYKKTIPPFGPLTIILFTEPKKKFSIRHCEVCAEE